MRREFIGIAIVLLALLGWWLWDQQRQLPLPPNAAGVESSINSTIAKETSFNGNWSEDEVRAFYRTALTQRGWRYCGDQRTEGCTNLFGAISDNPDIVDVYRRNDDTTNKGPTIEVWPTPREGVTYVKVFESREQS